MKEVFGGQGIAEKPTDMSRRKFLERAVVAGAVVAGIAPKESKAESSVENLNEMRAEVQRNDDIISFLKNLYKDDISSLNDYFVVSSDDYTEHTDRNIVIGGVIGAVVGSGIAEAVVDSKEYNEFSVPKAILGAGTGGFIGSSVPYNKKSTPEVVRRLLVSERDEYLRNTFFAEKELLTSEKVHLEMKRLEDRNTELLLKIKVRE